MPPAHTPAFPVLLLGAGGFLGRHIGAELPSAGHPLRLPAPGDLLSASDADWDKWLEGAGGLINAAGRTSGSLSDLTSANVLLTARVLEAASRNGVRLVHLASAAEYGRTAENHAVREDELASPLSPYGASKLAATVLVQQAALSGGLRATALRLTNPIGAGMNAGTLPGRAAHELTRAAREQAQVVHFGPLGAQRDFIDVRDAARAAVFALTAELGGVVNVGSGEARFVRELVGGLARLSGFDGQLHEDAPGSPRSGDVPYQCADVTRLRQSGFEWRYSFEDALAELLGPLVNSPGP